MADDLSPATASGDAVSADVIPAGRLPPLKLRDLPEPVSWLKMVGPSLMLAGLALGSGEFILWPYITYKSGFVFFWACLLGVLTQFFLNMEIERWTLVTGESAITGFCRLSLWWAPIMLVLNVLPWSWPGWATGAAQCLVWTFSSSEALAPPDPELLPLGTALVPYLGIAGLWLVGIVLTAGPVVYNTVERAQTVLVAFVLILITVIAVLVVRSDAVTAMAAGAVSIGQMPQTGDGLTTIALLGALAFAGAGGTTNLGQSNYIMDKGYAMGRFIGRITSPVTGQAEAIPETGYHFPHTAENLRRWRGWWRAANIEQFFSFLLTCTVCLCLMTLITYSLLYQPDGSRVPGTEALGDGISFIWGQAQLLAGQAKWGGLLRTGFLITGVAILLTTELGLLDATSRISADIVKTNLARHSETWTASRLYYLFLWSEILFGTAILLYGTRHPDFASPRFLVVTAAAMNGGVMFIYSLLLLYMNAKILPRNLSISPLRLVAITWSCAFFGYFTFQALSINVIPFLRDTFLGS